MKKNKNGARLIIFFDRSKVYFLPAKANDFLTLEFKEDVLKDLDIKNKEVFSAVVSQLIKENKVVPSKVAIVFSKNAMFSQELNQENKEISEEDQAKDYLQLVPFEDTCVKIFKYGKLKKIVVVNCDLYESLIETLATMEFEVDIVLDQESVEFVTRTEGFNLEIANEIVNSSDRFKSYNFLTGVRDRPRLEITASAKSPDKEGKKSNRMVYLGLVFFVLLLVLLFLLIWQQQQTNSISAQPVNYLQTETRPVKQNAVENSVEESALSEIITPKETQSATPAAKIDLTKVTVKILNGSGVARQADEIKDALIALGFEKIETGNASKVTVQKTLVVFSPDIPDQIRTQVLDVLAKFDDDYSVQENIELNKELLITTAK